MQCKKLKSVETEVQDRQENKKGITVDPKYL